MNVPVAIGAVIIVCIAAVLIVMAVDAFAGTRADPGERTNRGLRSLDARHCPACGSAVSDDEPACEQCGEQLRETPP